MQSDLKKSIPATWIAGDGSVPEIVDSTVRVLDALGASFACEAHQAGMAAPDLAGQGKANPLVNARCCNGA